MSLRGLSLSDSLTFLSPVLIWKLNIYPQIMFIHDQCVLSSHSIHFQPHKQAACVVKKVIFAFIWWWASKQGFIELWQCKDGFQSSGYPGQVCLLSLIHQRHDISLASHLAQHGTSTSVQSNPVSVVTSVSMPCPSGMPVQQSLVELLLLRVFFFCRTVCRARLTRLV